MYSYHGSKFSLELFLVFQDQHDTIARFASADRLDPFRQTFTQKAPEPNKRFRGNRRVRRRSFTSRTTTICREGRSHLWHAFPLVTFAFCIQLSPATCLAQVSPSLSALQDRVSSARLPERRVPLSSQCPPDALCIARWTGTGTSAGSEEKQETPARQRIGSSSSHRPPSINTLNG